jgi:hypothetical protein
VNGFEYLLCQLADRPASASGVWNLAAFVNGPVFSCQWLNLFQKVKILVGISQSLSLAIGKKTGDVSFNGIAIITAKAVS